jgi:hypothetical protein
MEGETRVTTRNTHLFLDFTTTVTALVQVVMTTEGKSTNVDESVWVRLKNSYI